jgi:hypothetical protein
VALWALLVLRLGRLSAPILLSYSTVPYIQNSRTFVPYEVLEAQDKKEREREREGERGREREQ